MEKQSDHYATELAGLMHDFFCTDAKDMYYQELASKVRFFREDEKGVAAMCKVMEDMRKESVMTSKLVTSILLMKV